MDKRNLLFFTLGVIATISIGAGSGAMILRNDGLEFPDGSAQTTAAAADARRSYYLTNFTRDGASVLNACATGYHMASLYEILDPSNLRYAVEHVDALTKDDSGLGPPSDAWGWIRTGEATPAPAVNQMGESNCLTWTSNAGTEFGTRVEIEDKWDSLGEFDHWDADTEGCDDVGAETGVWCVED